MTAGGLRGRRWWLLLLPSYAHTSNLQATSGFCFFENDDVGRASLFLTSVSVSGSRFVAGVASGLAVARSVPASASRSFPARRMRAARAFTFLL